MFFELNMFFDAQILSVTTLQIPASSLATEHLHFFPLIGADKAREVIPLIEDPTAPASVWHHHGVTAMTSPTLL